MQFLDHLKEEDLQTVYTSIKNINKKYMSLIKPKMMTILILKLAIEEIIS